MSAVLVEPSTSTANGDSQFVRADNWAPLVGNWTIEAGNVRYDGPGDDDVPAGYGIARSALRFRDGVIRLKITLSKTRKTSAGVLFGFRSPERAYFGATLGGFDRAYSILEFRPGEGWESIASAGSVRNLHENEAYAVEVHVEGQRVRLTVNDVDVVEAVLPRPLDGTGLCLYAYDKAKIHFADVEATMSAPRTFVVMPFREPFDTLYRDVIRPVARELNFDIVRADEIAGPGLILDDIRRQIEESHVIIAEISLPNPNVFYELGYAHALGKPAVLLDRRDRSEPRPFDISGYRAIPYDDTIGGKKAVELALRSHLEALRRDL